MKVKECPLCVAYLYARPILREAIASVSMESGKTVQRLALEFISAYHHRGHVEPAEEQA